MDIPDTAIISQADFPPNGRLDAPFVMLWAKLRPLIAELEKLSPNHIQSLIRQLPANDQTLPIILPGQFEAGIRGRVSSDEQRERLFAVLDGKPLEALVQCAAMIKCCVSKEMAVTDKLQTEAQMRLSTIRRVLKMFRDHEMPLAEAAANENIKPEEQIS